MQHNSETENMALLYSYGELPAEQEAAFSAHLKECEQCQQILFAASVTRAALPSLEAPAVPAALYAPQPAKEPWFSFGGFSFKRLVPAAVFVALVFSGISVYKIQVDRNVKAYQTSVAGIYSEVSNLETEISDIEAYIDSL